MVEEFEKMDAFLSKANLMMKRILHAITMQDISSIEHFLKDDVYENLQKEMEKDSLLNRHVIYDEVNVKSAIQRTFEDSDSIYIEVLFSIRALKYYVSNDSNEKNGNFSSRTEFVKKVLFTRLKNAKSQVAPRCFGCGSTIDYYQNGVCSNCGRVYDFELFDYVIQEMDW